MKAPQTLRRPANWQDFESLCKKLWGEIWNCPEIQKNGRLGQDQSGVDIYGIPSGEKAYYGIQCKGKSEYNDEQYAHPQFTEKEIEEELKKAEAFAPPLKKFYLATTALNDSKIQTFIRQKNIEYQERGLFEVHLFCWETIVDLIDGNKGTHDWYVNSQNYKTSKSVSVTFHDNSCRLEAKVTFKQQTTYYQLSNRTVLGAVQMAKMQNVLWRLNQIQRPFNHSEVNHSCFRFNLRIRNTGRDPIENYKIFLNFDGDFIDLYTPMKGGYLISPSIQFKYDTYINKEKQEGKIVPLRDILVGGDYVNFDDIIIKPVPVPTTLRIHWTLVSKDFKDNGELELVMTPEVREEKKYVIVDNETEVRSEKGSIEDFITYNEDKE